MIIEIYDEEKDKCLSKIDIFIGLDVIIINDIIEDNYFNYNKQDLHKWLMDRTLLPKTYEIDEIVLKKLGLYNNRHLFGRMNEARCLYALLNNFKSDKDEIMIYPIKDEIISMVSIDYRYSNIYLWRKRRKFLFKSKKV